MMRTRLLITRRRLATLTLAALGASPLTGPSALASRQPGSGILFIGNSLTHANDLPILVQTLFDNAGGARYEVAMRTAPNFSLEDHWEARDARREIERGGWQVVVLQQGPSSRPINRNELREYTRRFSESIAAIGARAALYSVWPSQARAEDFDRAIESYALAAASVGALLFPVASAWRAAWRRDASVPLYSRDGLHPSPTGSFLAALVMYGVIAGRSPVGLPTVLQLRNGRTLPVPARLAALLQAAAAEAIEASH